VDPVRLQPCAEALETTLVTHVGSTFRAARGALRALPLVELEAVFLRLVDLAATFPLVGLAASFPLADPLGCSRRAKRGGSPSCFRQRTRPRPISTCTPPHCGHGSGSDRLNETHSHCGQLAQP